MIEDSYGNQSGSVVLLEDCFKRKWTSANLNYYLCEILENSSTTECLVPIFSGRFFCKKHFNEIMSRSRELKKTQTAEKKVSMRKKEKKAPRPASGL